jgi:hypothetical protein
MNIYHICMNNWDKLHLFNINRCINKQQEYVIVIDLLTVIKNKRLATNTTVILSIHQHLPKYYTDCQQINVQQNMTSTSIHTLYNIGHSLVMYIPCSLLCIIDVLVYILLCPIQFILLIEYETWISWKL